MSDTGAGTKIKDVIPANMSHLYTVDTDPESFTDPDKESYRGERAELRDDFVERMLQILENCYFNSCGTIYLQTENGKIYKIEDDIDRYFITQITQSKDSSRPFDCGPTLTINMAGGTQNHIYPVSDSNVRNMRVVFRDLESGSKAISMYDPSDIFNDVGGKELFETVREIVIAALDELETSELVEVEKVNCEENASVYSVLESLMPEGVHFFEIGLYDRKYKVTKLGNDFRIKVMRYQGVDEYKYETDMWVLKEGNEDYDSCIPKEHAEKLAKVFPMLFVKNRTGEVLDA